MNSRYVLVTEDANTGADIRSPGIPCGPHAVAKAVFTQVPLFRAFDIYVP